MKNLVNQTGYWILILLSILSSCKEEEVPTLSTYQIASITWTTASGGGYISSEGSGAVLERGVCWSTGTEPTVADNKTSDGAGAG